MEKRVTYTRILILSSIPLTKVVGIIDDPSDCKAALHDLRQAGFKADEIEVLTGEEGSHRRDYGITWGHTMDNGGLDVGNEVMINLQLEALQPAPKPAGP